MNTTAAGDETLPGAYQEILAQATRHLGGTLLPDTVSSIAKAGDAAQNNRRIYHTLEHFRQISSAHHTKLLEDLPPLVDEFHRLGFAMLYDTVVSVMVRAGAHHDIVYHVDIDYIPASTLRDERYRILPPRSIDAPRSDYVVTGTEPSGEAGVILDMARCLFDVLPRDILTQFNGKNEFLSAVYAGLQGLKEKIPLKYLLAEMMMIEATRPFEPPSRMEALRSRFEAANRLLPSSSQLDAQEIDAFLAGAAHLANVDVLDFSRDFNHFLKGSVSLLHEAGRPIVTPEDYFTQATNREAFFLNLLEKMHNEDAAIFHGLHFTKDRDYYFPQRGALEICEKRARENIRKDILMSRALKVSAALVVAVETACGQGDTDGLAGKLARHQADILAGYPAMRDPSMIETAMAMRDCASGVPLLGLASYLLGHLSETNLLRLSEKTGHQFQAYQERFTAAFATRKSCRELLDWLKEYGELRALESAVTHALGYTEDSGDQAQAK